MVKRWNRIILGLVGAGVLLLSPTVPALTAPGLDQADRPGAAQATSGAIAQALPPDLEPLREQLRQARRQQANGQQADAQATLAQAETLARQVADPVLQGYGLSLVARAYADIGAFDQAIALSRALPYDLYAPDNCCQPVRMEAELAIVRAYQRANQLPQAEAFALQLEAPGRSTVGVAVVEAWAAAGQFDRAIALSERLTDDPYSQTMAQNAILKGYINANQLRPAWLYTQRIATPSDRANARLVLAQAAWRSGQPELALQISNSIEDPQAQGQMLQELAGVYTRIGEPEAARAVLEQAYAIARNFPDSFYRPTWAMAFAQVGDFDRAEQEIEAADPYYERAEVRLAIARAAIGRHEYRRAFTLAQQVRDGELQVISDYPDPKLEVLRQLQEQAFASGDEALAAEVARAFGPPDLRVKALVKLATAFIASDRPEAAAPILREAHQLAQTIDQIYVTPERNSYYSTSNASLLVDIATQAMAMGDQEQAIALLQEAIVSIRQFDFESSAMMFASHLSEIGVLGQVARMAHQLEQPNLRDTALDVALEIAMDLETLPGLRATSISQIARTWGMVGQPERGLAIAREHLSLEDSSLDPVQRFQVATEITATYLALGDTATGESMGDRARALIDYINTTPADWHRYQLALAFTQAESTTLALRTAESITDPSQRFQALNAIAQAYVTANRPEAATQVVQHLRQFGETLAEDGRHDEFMGYALCYQGLAPTCSDGPIWKYDLAQTLAQDIQSPLVRSRSLAIIAWGLSSDGATSEAQAVMAQALQTTQEIENMGDRRDLLLFLFDELTRVNQWELATQVAMAFPQPGYRIAALRRIAQDHAWRGEGAIAQQRLNEARQQANALSGPERATVLAAIARQASQITNPR